MPALNFKKHFAEKILKGFKKQTIRLPRKRPIRVGDKLYLYTGMRTKQCELIATTECIEVRKIELRRAKAKLGGRIITYHDAFNLAVRDGFTGYHDMLDFFEEHYGLPFKGRLIKWGDLILPEGTDSNG